MATWRWRTAYEAAADLPHAAIFYQQVYYRYPASDAAQKAGAALGGAARPAGRIVSGARRRR